MTNMDQLFRFLFDELDIRGELVYLNTSWQTVLQRHPYPNNVKQQLGEAMAAAALLSSTIKFDGSLILQIQGDGPLNTLVAQASSKGKLRGLAKWKTEVPQGNLAEVYGKGQILISVMNEQSKPYQSIVALAGDNIAHALENYFLHSEQLKSHFWFFVSDTQVAALFLQELPSQLNSKEQKQENWERINMLASTLTANELFELSAEDLLHRLFHAEQVRLYEPKALEFECGCSQGKIEQSLIAMGQASLLEILQEEGQVEVDCEFCKQHYYFGLNEINQLFPDDEMDILH